MSKWLAKEQVLVGHTLLDVVLAIRHLLRAVYRLFMRITMNLYERCMQI